MGGSDCITGKPAKQTSSTHGRGPHAWGGVCSAPGPAVPTKPTPETALAGFCPPGSVLAPCSEVKGSTPAGRGGIGDRVDHVRGQRVQHARQKLALFGTRTTWKKNQAQTSFVSQNSQSTADFPVTERRAGLGFRNLGVRHTASVSSSEHLRVRCSPHMLILNLSF